MVDRRSTHREWLPLSPEQLEKTRFQEETDDDLLKQTTPVGYTNYYEDDPHLNRLLLIHIGKHVLRE